MSAQLAKILTAAKLPWSTINSPIKGGQTVSTVKHIFQHFQLEQACEEASHRFITSRLLTHVEKIYMLHCASLFFLYEM